MKDLWKKVWYSEPVVFVGALATGWTSLAAFDKFSDGFGLPVWSYAAAAVTIPVLTGLVRGKVSPVSDG